VNIALDYDNTYTKDPYLWDQFILLFNGHGHYIWIVTLRNEVQDAIELDPYIRDCIVGIIYCDGMPKDPTCYKRGIYIDIWIDDEPQSVHHGSRHTKETLAEWRLGQSKSNAPKV
jgi:hypothetical protein